MKLVVGYDILKSALTYVSNVSNTQSSLEANKTVVFSVSQEAVTLYGESATVGAVTEIERGNFTAELPDEEEFKLFQVKTKELKSFLDTFVIDRTYPTDVEFVIDNNKLNLTVNEEPLDGQPSYLQNSSSWVFDLSAIKKSTLEAMKIGRGEEPVSTELLQIYIDAMFPVLNGSDVSMNDSKVHFDDNNVFVFTSRIFAMFKNKLPLCMRGIVLGYPAVQLLKDLCANFEQVFVSKDDAGSKLLVSAGNTNISIKYNRKMPDYTKMLESIKEDNYMELDRKMLSSTVRRLKLVPNNKTELKVKLGEEESFLSVDNKRFTQNIPLTETGGDLSDFKVLVQTNIIEDAILGADNMYPDNLIISATKNGNTFTISFSDESKNWMTAFVVLASK